MSLAAPPRFSLACAAVATALVVWSGAAAAAGSCPIIDGGSPALGSEDDAARLAFVRSVMKDQADRANRWMIGWSATGFAIAAGEFALVPLMNENRRVEEAVAGMSSFYIPASVAVLPLRAPDDDETLEQAVAAADAQGDAGARCLVLARAEALLEDTATDEARRTGVFQHVFGVVLSGGYAAAMWAFFHDPAGVAVNGVGALLLSEAQIFTAPRGAMQGLEQYRRDTLGGPSATRALSWTIAPMTGGVGVGVGVVGAF